MQAEATELNIGFMKRMREGLPWVRVKLAMSLDGRTALANGASQWITGEAARADVQRWRARCSAVLTGVGTVIADDPQLNVRAAGFKGRQPLRVVLDARLRSPGGAKMFVGLASGAAAGGAAGPSSGVRPVAAVSASGPGGVSSAGVGVGGAATVRAGGAAASGGTAAIAGLPVAVGGEVLIFTAVGGGLSAAGPARSAGPVDPSALADDLAELVNAFETSPTSVAARSAEMAGPVSVRTEAPGAAAAAFGPGGSAAGAHPAGAGAAASRAVSASGADVAAGQGSGAAGATSSVSATASSVPPILAAATSALGAASTADDATWAGAALSGAIPVKTDVKSPPDDGKESALVGAAVGGHQRWRGGTDCVGGTVRFVGGCACVCRFSCCARCGGRRGRTWWGHRSSRHYRRHDRCGEWRECCRGSCDSYFRYCIGGFGSRLGGCVCWSASARRGSDEGRETRHTCRLPSPAGGVVGTRRANRRGRSGRRLSRSVCGSEETGRTGRERSARRGGVPHWPASCSPRSWWTSCCCTSLRSYSGHRADRSSTCRNYNLCRMHWVSPCSTLNGSAMICVCGCVRSDRSRPRNN